MQVLIRLAGDPVCHTATPKHMEAELNKCSRVLNSLWELTKTTSTGETLHTGSRDSARQRPGEHCDRVRWAPTGSVERC